MRKVTNVIKEGHNMENKRQTTWKKRSEETSKRTQKAKTLICEIRMIEMSKEEIEKRIEAIVGKGSSQEVVNTSTKDKIIERIVEIAKREEQFEEWEKMRQDAKRRQWEDRRLNIFWRRNKSFPVQCGGEEETPNAEETLNFWRAISNKEVSEEWREDGSIREVLGRVRLETRRRRCPWYPFKEDEFEEVLR